MPLPTSDPRQGGMSTFTNPADIVADWLRMATVAQPKLLLLDEHTAALGPGAAER